nr:hypothetical protein BACY1_14610 [Tenacibaculum mesophilum]
MTRFLQYLILILVLYSCKQHNPQEEKLNKGYSIVDLYKKPISKWPKPIIDEGVEWQEMKPIEINYNYFEDIKKPEVTLGKLLFLIPNYRPQIKYHVVLVIIQKWDGQLIPKNLRVIIIYKALEMHLQF